MGSKTRIFIVLEYVMGGELHDIIVSTIIPLRLWSPVWHFSIAVAVIEVISTYFFFAWQLSEFQ